MLLSSDDAHDPRAEARERAMRFLEQHLHDMAELKMKVDATMRMVHDIGDRLFNRPPTPHVIDPKTVRAAARGVKEVVDIARDVVRAFFGPR